jgi:hypothetical protein
LGWTPGLRETYTLLNARLGVVPGNSAHNVRRLALLETDYVDRVGNELFTIVHSRQGATRAKAGLVQFPASGATKIKNQKSKIERLARRTGRFPQLVDSRSGVNCVLSPLFRREHSPAERPHANERNPDTKPYNSA